MSIQSSINQMLSSITNNKLYENIYKSLKNTETNVGGLTEEQKALNDLLGKHGGIKNLTQDAEYGKERIKEQIKLRQEYPDIDDTATRMFKSLSDMAKTRFNSVEELRGRIENIAQTRTNMARILAEDTQDTVKERFEQSKGGAQK